MRGYDDWLANSAPGVNDEEREITVEVECPNEECSASTAPVEVDALFITDGSFTTDGALYWTCPVCKKDVERDPYNYDPREDS